MACCKLKLKLKTNLYSTIKSGDSEALKDSEVLDLHYDVKMNNFLNGIETIRSV